MDAIEVSIQTTYSFEVNFNIEAIEHYDAVHTSGDFPRSSIIASDGRNADAWIFFAYENDTGGHIGSSDGNICGSWNGAFEGSDPSGHPNHSDTPLVNVRWCL